MPSNDLKYLARSFDPSSTVLFFGAGSSISSHAPSTEKLIAHLSKEFGQTTEGFTLAEVTELIERKSKDRKRLIASIRTLFQHLEPTRGLLTVPLYDWKSIYTTNYDELVEDAYRRRGANLTVYDSNFDFTVKGKSLTTKLYKLHGTIS